MFINFLIGTLTLTTPLFFWTLTPSVFSTPKEVLFILVVLLLLGTFIVKLVSPHKLHSLNTPLTLPLTIFVLTIIATLAFNPEGRPEALTGKGLILILLAGFSLLTLSLANLPRLTKTITTTLLASTTLLSLHSLLSLSFLSRSNFVPAIMQNASFTPTGSYLTTLGLIVVGLTLAISLLKKPSLATKNYGAALIVLHVIAIVAIVSLMLPGAVLSPTLLSYQASWSIALDALKSLRSLLVGIGLSNYTLLYTSVKPLSINLTPLWNTLPPTATSELLTLLPTAGILATLSFIFLMIKGLVWTRNTQLALPFIVTSLLFILIPASLPIYLIFFLLLILSVPEQQEMTSLTPGFSRLLATILALIGLSVIYSSGKAYASEMILRRSQLALSAGDSQTAYDLHLRSIRLSPTIASYHLSFADLNFRLASSLSQKESLSDGDRETVTTLIQQSILSNKTALQLRPNSSAGWISLAKIYQNLINVADKADQFSLDYYAKAISLDRANPLLRLEYGNLLSQLSSTQKVEADQRALSGRAKAEFQTAIQLKNNYANAYYNLAKIYETEGDFASAVSSMQQVIKYLDVSSTDYNQALAELETLKLKLPKPVPTPAPTPTPTASTELTTPSPLPSPLPGGPLDLPEVIN